MAEEFLKAIPILRIFDEAKARAFYVDYLGFKVDWEHRFEPGLPLYMQVSRGALTLHLSGHHGDCTPGSTVYVPMTGIRDYHAELRAKDYPNLRPGLEDAPWGATTMELLDPFGNRLRLAENKTEQA
jgi:catechol 2,3-dioxygenase-like lactoylglutathione lyase family enzyme